MGFNEEYQMLLDGIFRRFPSVQNTGFTGDSYKPGLGRMREFLRLLGQPHESFKSVHVAGTNGKGSVSSMIASVLASNGRKTGLYTSPHILDFRERMKVIDNRAGEVGATLIPKDSFYMAPMVHWPEVMVSYESTDKVLFSADAFGKFGTIDADEGWSCEARRYYFNIVGKYGKQVQALLAKAAPLDIQTICPLHGPVLTDTIPEVINLYKTWSAYEPENKGVFIAAASIHGNTLEAAEKMKEILEAKGCPRVAMADLSRDDIAECVEDGFRHSVLLCMASSYDGGVFAPMSDYLHHLEHKTFQNRKVALVENTSWAPSAIRTMKAEFEKMKNITILDKTVSIKTRLTEANIKELEELADIIIENV